MPEDALKLLANHSTREILHILAEGPSYPRAIAARLGLSEGDVQRKLHRLERAGFVSGAWRHRDKTVKEYHVSAQGIRFDFKSGVLDIAGPIPPETSGVPAPAAALPRFEHDEP